MTFQEILLTAERAGAPFRIPTILTMALEDAVASGLAKRAARGRYRATAAGHVHIKEEIGPMDPTPRPSLDLSI